jgi:hypothetical protein
MLSLDQIRRIDPNLSDIPDEELLKIRNKLYGIVDLALDNLEKAGVPKSPLGYSSLEKK